MVSIIRYVELINFFLDLVILIDVMCAFHRQSFPRAGLAAVGSFKPGLCSKPAQAVSCDEGFGSQIFTQGPSNKSDAVPETSQQRLWIINN